MKDRNVILLDRLGDLSDLEAGYRCGGIRGVQFLERTVHQVQQLLHALFQLLPFVVQFLLAILFHTLQHYLLEKFRDVVIQNLP